MVLPLSIFHTELFMVLKVEHKRSLHPAEELFLALLLYSIHIYRTFDDLH